MSAITPVTSMPADSASPSGMLTSALPQIRVQAKTVTGGAKLTVIQKNEGGVWFKVPQERVLAGKSLGQSYAALSLDVGEVGEITVSNPFGSTAYHVLQENGGYAGNESGTVTAYIASASAAVSAGDLSSANIAASGTLTVGGAATLSSTLAVTGAATLTGGGTLGANLAAGGFKVTGLGAASANGDALRYEQGGMLAGALSTGTIGAATKYMNRGAATVAASAVCVATVTRAGVLRRLYANLLTAPGGTDTVAFTIQKSSDNGATWSDTTLTCTVTGTAKGNSDTTHAPSVAAGDLLAVKMVSSAATAADPSVGFEIL